MPYKFKNISYVISAAPSIKEKGHQVFCREGKRKEVLRTNFYKLIFATRKIYFCWIRISATNPKYIGFTCHDSEGFVKNSTLVTLMHLVNVSLLYMCTVLWKRGTAKQITAFHYPAG